MRTILRPFRLQLANHLGALKGSPYDAKVQEDFQQGGDTLLDTLADDVRECRRHGRAQNARPPRLGKLARGATFPHSHKPHFVNLRERTFLMGGDRGHF